MDQEINLRGVPVDIENVKHIVNLTSQREEALLARFQTVTRSAVSGPRSYVALRDWANLRTGMNVDSVDVDATKIILKQLKDKTEYADVYEALTIKAELGKSSVAKFKTMLGCANADNRIRGSLQYGGASTMRWAARKVQYHNQPRDSFNPETWEDIIRHFKNCDIPSMKVLYDDPFYSASRCVRGAIRASEGKELICSDLSSIEAVGNAYLAGETEVLQNFAAKRDLYKISASKIFNIPYEEISKHSKERQVGKVSDLAMGYGGGIGAFVSMAKTYNLDLETLPPFVLPSATSDELDGRYGAKTLSKMYISKNPDTISLDAAIACDVIKRRWRIAHPATVASWKGYENAAKSALTNTGVLYSYGRVKYICNEGFLKCLVPSGRLMHYYNPSILTKATDWDEESKSISYWGLKVTEGKTTRQWTVIYSYGGKLCENIVQAFSRDILAYNMLRINPLFPIVLHVHDEACSEVPCGAGDLNLYNQMISTIPPWAAGMPIKAEGWVGKRYRKN
jgi:DNA polymerase